MAANYPVLTFLGPNFIFWYICCSIKHINCICFSLRLLFPSFYFYVISYIYLSTYSNWCVRITLCFRCPRSIHFSSKLSRESVTIKVSDKFPGFLAVLTTRMRSCLETIKIVYILFSWMSVEWVAFLLEEHFFQLDVTEVKFNVTCAFVPDEK